MKGGDYLSVILVLTFVGSNGRDVVFSFPYAYSECSESQVKALVNAIITNGDIFTLPPVQFKKARLLTFQDYDIEATS